MPGILIIALALVAGIGTAQADTRLVYDSAQGQSVISIRPGALRIDTPGDAWQLYVEQSNTMFTVRPDEHSYTRLDESMIDTLGGQMARLRDKINAELDKLPPDKRRAARAALGEQLPGFAGKQEPPTLENTGDTDQVTGIACHAVRVMRGGQAVKHMCIASAEALGLSKAGFATVTAMYELMHAMTSRTGLSASDLPYSRLQGIPIRIREASGDTRRRLIDVDHQPLDTGLFDVPDDFVEQSLESPAQ